MSIDSKLSIAFLITLLMWGCQKSINNSQSKPQCGLDNFKDDPNVPQIVKDIYFGNYFNLKNDEEALALLDSLDSENKITRKFYFKVVLKSSIKADGYYSEGLGERVKEYIEEATEEFASYFDDHACFEDKDLEASSILVLGELKILSESVYDKSIIEEFHRNLIDNCKECSSAQIATIEKFTRMLNTKWVSQ